MSKAIWFALGLVAGPLAACSNVPGFPSFPERPQGMTGSQGTYRDLADLPPKPPAPEPAEDQKAIKSLTEDRARAAQEGDDLRQEPFSVPDPPPPSGF
jgi:hypothetical protein